MVEVGRTFPVFQLFLLQLLSLFLPLSFPLSSSCFPCGGKHIQRHLPSLISFHFIYPESSTQFLVITRPSMQNGGSWGNCLIGGGALSRDFYLLAPRYAWVFSFRLFSSPTAPTNIILPSHIKLQTHLLSHGRQP